jgi:hypothetical protein
MSRRMRIAAMIALAVLIALVVAVVLRSPRGVGPDVDPNHPMPLF